MGHVRIVAGEGTMWVRWGWLLGEERGSGGDGCRGRNVGQVGMVAGEGTM